MANRPLLDAPARKQSVTDFTTNLVVLAGAGTGKTSLLIERVLNAIGGGELTLERMAALTFTKMASAEMRERLARGLDTLYRLANGANPSDEGSEAGRAWRYLSENHEVTAIAERILAALESIELAEIATIHGFCSDLLRANPREAGIDPDFDIDNGEQVEQLFEEYWRRFLSGRLRPDDEACERWLHLLDRLSIADVRSIAHDLKSFSIDSIPTDGESASNAGDAERAYLNQSASTIAAALLRIIEEQPDLTEKTLEHASLASRLLSTYVDGGQAAVVNAIQHSGASFNAMLKASLASPGVKVPEDAGKALADGFKRAKRLLRRLQHLDDPSMTEVICLLRPFVLEFQHGMLRQGLVSYDDLLRLARNLLRDHPTVRDTYKQRYRMLLVDEFQDTDPLQYEIVFFLTGEVKSTTNNAYEERLSPGRLFIVGDSKQSIYRFRGADFDAFQRAVDHVKDCGGAVLDLTSNFRSDAALLEGINDLFRSDATGWIASGLQPEYVPLDSTRKGSCERPIEIWTIGDAARIKARERRVLEGRILAQGVIEAVATEGVGYQDCTIVMRAMTQLSFYTRALQAAGIPFVVDGGQQFLERTEVTQFLALLSTLFRPADQASLIAFLRSPAGGVDDIELTRYADERRRWDWELEHPPAEPFPVLARRFEELRQLAAETRELSPSLAIHHILRRSRLLILHASGFEGPQRVANLYKVATAVARRVSDGRSTVAEVVATIRSGGIKDLQADSPLSDDAAPAVRLITVHKMKGLESAVIFVPDLARLDRNSQPPKWNVRSSRLSDGPGSLAVRLDTICNEAAIASELIDSEHESAEELRVLYVALTRAARRLVLISAPSKQTNPWQRALAAWGYDAATPPTGDRPLEHPAVLHREVFAGDFSEVQDDAYAVDPTAATRRWQLAVTRLKNNAAGSFRAPSDHDVPSPDPGLAPPTVAPGESGRALGTVVHLALESWSGDASALNERGRALAAQVALDEQLDQDRLVAATSELLNAFSSSELAERLEQVQVVGREIPLLLRESDGTHWRGSIDLLYRDEDQALIVADYKTDRDADPQRLTARYADQLKIYARAVQVAYALPALPACEIWALRTGKRIRI